MIDVKQDSSGYWIITDNRVVPKTTVLAPSEAQALFNAMYERVEPHWRGEELRKLQRK